MIDTSENPAKKLVCERVNTLENSEDLAICF